MEMGEIERFMYLAQLEGRRALPDCLPNPPAGCVIVNDGEVVASGYTGAPGKMHAEAKALSHVEEDLSSHLVFVTLEPCSFYGRTPACANALIRRRPGHIYVGCIDPDIRNNGRGIGMIRNAGLSVTVGILQAQIQSDLYRYLNVQKKE
jgi:pyrimidine deaminase RibD-like protein